MDSYYISKKRVGIWWRMLPITVFASATFYWCLSWDNYCCFQKCIRCLIILHVQIYTPLSPRVSWYILGNNEPWKPKEEDGSPFNLITIIRPDHFMRRTLTQPCLFMYLFSFVWWRMLPGSVVWRIVLIHVYWSM